MPTRSVHVLYIEDRESLDEILSNQTPRFDVVMINEALFNSFIDENPVGMYDFLQRYVFSMVLFVTSRNQTYRMYSMRRVGYEHFIQIGMLINQQ